MQNHPTCDLCKYWRAGYTNRPGSWGDCTVIDAYEIPEEKRSEVVRAGGDNVRFVEKATRSNHYCAMWEGK